ncbi:Cullin-domain-containing protein [Coniophora puteana RWD-64-598 SS2]|uniref:Cullin-domain-containing protein n=1 Tax=Coniophora puteana (strain RWD-64-598) TaxID=741705 RepID=A0A5M3MXN1_CONPW|nr:Cullin-domain-containing protein [Coniophora puteana RWD-64-598 SS2]EIW83862.1 Cullin-domain-containing protein [Coniophora puteana RWD-64-598 SS2]
MDDTWAQLSANIREIHNHNASRLSFEENHRFGYNMVLHKHGEMLYRGVCELVAENVERLARTEIFPAFPQARGVGVGGGAAGAGAVAGMGAGDTTQQSQEGEQLLKAMRKVWDDHTSNMSKLRDILKYMDRVYTKANNVPEIWDAGLDLFLKHIIRPPIQAHVVDAVLSLIRIERDGFPINRSAVRECVDVLLQLRADRDGRTVYKRDLEPAVLRASERFYAEEGKTLLETCDAPEYLRRAESRFDSEQARTHHYLSAQTAAPLQQILQNHLLTPNLVAVLTMPNSGLDTLIDLNRLDDLSRLYRLFTMVPPGLPTLRRALKDSILRRGREINQASTSADAMQAAAAAADAMQAAAAAADDDADVEDAAKGKGKGKAREAPAGSQMLSMALKWVQDVLDLKDKFDYLWKQSFDGNREIEGTLNEAFEDFINLNEKASEFISLFIDDNLKKGLKGKTDTEVDIVLDKTITVFRYITEKDAFERYYKSHLAKRLLLGRSVSDDAERGMLAKLKVECGYQFTQKLEGMFQDMKISTDTMQAYRKYLETSTPPDVEISVTVMTSTFWPMSYSAASCVFPDDLTRACKSFEQFYFSRHSGRRLTWQPTLGNADVRVQFRNRKHDLNVSTFALVILLLFEKLGENEFLTYEEIKAATLIPEVELQRHLQSLACAKYKILKKHPPSRDVHASDSFSFNVEFSSPMQRIKISTVSARVETNEERKETRGRIDEERAHQTEACIVRVMKDRKHMTHNELVNEVTRQLSVRFQPNPQNIKKRIEGLIDREYLERCDDRKSYNYLA